MMPDKEDKDIWDKLTSLSALLASVLVPVVIVFVGNIYTGAIKKAAMRIYELLIEIEKRDPDRFYRILEDLNGILE